MTVYEKLMNVQNALVVNKTRATNRYKYRSAEDILEAVKPILKEQKAVILLSDETIEIEKRFYIRVTATFVDVESGENVSVSSCAREDETSKLMQTAQVTGSSISYARKYALGGLLCIDDGNDADKRTEQAEKEEKKQLLNLIYIELERTGVQEETILITYRLEHLEDADNAILGSIYRRLQKTQPLSQVGELGGEGC